MHAGPGRLVKELRVRSNHEPVTDAARLLSAFGVVWPQEVEPWRNDSADVMAPFIVQAEHPGSDALGDLKVGLFGLLPSSAQDAGLAMQARSCRVETMKSNPTFRESWWAGRRCVVPVEALTEWSYAAGQPGIWRIGRADQQPMGFAGLWNTWTSPSGETLLSFCVLSISGDGHAVFERLSPPSREKRMPVILCAEAQRQWLHGTGAQVQRLLVQFPAEQLQASPLEPVNGPSHRPSRRDWLGEADMFADEWWTPVARAPRKKRSVVPRAPSNLPEPITGDLFG